MDNYAMQGNGLDKGNEIDTETKPQLWNPNVAACWCLIFNPIFGAWIHAKNWKTLNKPKEEKWSMFFVYFLILFYLFIIFGEPIYGELKTNSVSLTVMLLCVWYGGLGRLQVNHIKENISDYDRKSWLKPFFWGLLAYGILFITLFLTPLSTTDIEESSVSIVNQILKEQTEYDKICESVSITEKLENGSYKAFATLNDGSNITLIIKLDGEMLYVEIE